ncbi:hypothetical protein MKEN_01127200 [Mycena kentingensis (nom. inval.)]|nr:hypothetical protein MKEN_01127200 [Mycena kentingensis (nom. inval.)]
MALVILDDQDNRLQYSGQWIASPPASSSRYYFHTSSGSRANNATLTFTFSGTSAKLVGGYDANTSCSGTFVLDSASTAFTSPNTTTPPNQQVIWSAASLQDAEHTLTFTLASCSVGSTAAFWLDYVLYAPSVNASTSDVLYFIDDADQRLAYTGNWTSQTGNDGDFELTSHVGYGGASFRLDFEGSLVSMHGRIGNDTNGASTKATFFIDGGAPFTFSSLSQNKITFNQALFQSDSLRAGNHTLVGTSQSGSLWVDYVLVQPSAPGSDAVETPSHSAFGLPAMIGVAVAAVALAVGIALAVILRKRFTKGGRCRTPARHRKSRPVISAPNVASFRHVGHTPLRPNAQTIYPPIPSSSESIRSQTTSNPFDTPPPSPRARSYTTVGSSSFVGPPIAACDPLDAGYATHYPRASTFTATSTSGSGASVPISATASASGRSRRFPSVGGDGDSIVDLKRRQQAYLAAQTSAVPAYDDLHHHTDTTSISAPSIGGISHSSSVRPLPQIPSASLGPPVASGSGSGAHDFDDLPPVYTNV